MPVPEVVGAPAAPSHAAKLQVVKAKTSDQGQVVYLRFVGVVDEDFSGQRLAQTINCRMLVIDLSGVRRISSYGIAEWSNFIRHVCKRVETVYLVACSPKVVDQLNLVTEFAGGALMHSFLAPYRCDACDAESVRLLQMDTDWEMIKSQHIPDFPCGVCGNAYTFDENPPVYLSYAIRQGPVAIPQEVQTYVAAELAARLDAHGESIGPTFWAEKFVKDRCSYLRLTGNLDGTFPDRKLLEGLEGTIVLDVAGVTKVYQAGAALWRNFIEAIKPAAEAIYLAGVPVAFESLRNEDYLAAEGGVISLSLPFSCAECRTTWDSLVDVEENIDLIRMATPPERQCPDCKGVTVCVAPEAVLARLTKLRKPAAPAAVRKFMDEAHRKLKEAHKKPAASTVDAAGRRSPAGFLIGAGALAVVAAAVAVVVILLRREVGATALKNEEAAKLLQSSSPERPAWVASDMPLHGECKATGDLVRCTGVSSYAETLDEGRAQAEVSALDGFVQYTALQVTDATWQRKVSGLYGAARTAKLENLEKARQQPDRGRYESAIKEVVDSRRAVVKALRKTGGSLAPSQVSHEYWEEYQVPESAATRYLVFASVEVPAAQPKRVAELYATPIAVREAKSVTAFPGIAWRYPEIESGAMLLELESGGLRAIGLTDRYIVTSVQDRVVDTADSFKSILSEELDKLKSGGSIKLVVKTGDTPPVEFSHPVQTIIRPPVDGRGGRGSSRPSSSAGSTPLNTWDRVGGDRKFRDDPRE